MRAKGLIGLKTVIAKVYEKDPSRIVLPDTLQKEERYDFVLVPPHQMDPPEMHHLLQQAIGKHFHVSATVESRPSDVYVMTLSRARLRPPRPAMSSNHKPTCPPRVWTSDQMAVANAHELEPIQKNINDSTQA